MVGMDYHSDCLKIVVDFATTRSLSTSMDMPNTYDQSEDRFEWRTFEFMEYALVPREFNQGIARVDLYILMDEDDLDVIDEVRYIADFLTNELIPQWNGFTVQWAPAVTGPWSSNWLALDSLVVTGSQTTASVPPAMAASASPYTSIR